jgi:hypothetical protein
MQLGRTWTALIVTQVAVVVAVLPFAGWVAGESVRRAAVTPAYPADQILRTWMSVGTLVVPPGTEPAEYEQAYKARFLEPAAEVLRRLEAEPAVAGVTFGRVFSNGPFEQIEADGGETQRTLVSSVDVDYFSVFDVPLLVGRGFVDADTREGSNGVVINRLFAERVFGNADVVGRRIRRVSANAAGAPGSVEPGPWLEIIGVVPEFMAPVDLEPPRPRLFEPVALEDVASGFRLSVRTAGPSAPVFAARLREIAEDVDPALELHELTTAAEEERQAGRLLNYVALGVTLLVLSVVLLSAAGIYAMMSFTVARRRREIAIQASAQLGAGVLVGLLLAALLRRPAGGQGLLLLPLVAAFMLAVGLLAALGPARRGLAVQPTEALQQE